MSRFENVLFANVLSRFANVLGQFPNCSCLSDQWLEEQPVHVFHTFSCNG